MEERKWFKEMSVYQIWPRSFCDGTGDGIGDLKGVLSKLEYIKSLGSDAIWFSPLYVSPQADYGYDIADYKNINAEYGTLDDFKAVLDKAHDLGMRVIMDLVINHTSDQHEWFKKSCARIEPYTDFYIWRKGRGKDGKKAPNNWMSTFPGSAWEFNEQRGEFYLHLYAKEQPDLNHDNPKVREAVKDVMRFWLDMGVDGFREDVITQISKREGLPNGNWLMPASRGMEHYNNGPHIHEYLQEYRKVIEQYDAFQVGEAPLMNVKTALTYVNENKKELDMMISFQHMGADCIIIDWVHTPFNLVKLKKTFNEWQTKLYHRAWNANYLENHDHARIISRYGSEDYRVESGKALAMIYSFLSGTHFIYQGQEIGMTSLYFDKYPKGSDPWAQFKDVSTFCVRDLMRKFGFRTSTFSKWRTPPQEIALAPLFNGRAANTPAFPRTSRGTPSTPTTPPSTSRRQCRTKIPFGISTSVFSPFAKSTRTARSTANLRSNDFTTNNFSSTTRSPKTAHSSSPSSPTSAPSPLRLARLQSISPPMPPSFCPSMTSRGGRRL